MNCLKKLNAESLCRICLTQSKKMILLRATLNNMENGSPRIIEALEKVMSVKLSPVEIIIGSNKYDLKDVVIIEEEKKDQEEFRGFLDNLGKTITAKFVNRSNRKHCSKNVNEEEPVVLIEKIDTQNIEILYDDNSVQKPGDKSTVEDVDKYIIVQGDDLRTQNGANILKENCLNLEEFGLENLTDVDQELFQSALNMQLQCRICNKLYSSRGRLKRHLEACGKVEYQIIEDEKGEPTIAIAPTILGCHICSRTFKEKKFLNYHIKTTHSAEPLKYTCDVCGHIARNRNAYVYHKLTRHGERKYICDICGKKFFTSSTLKTHTLNHAHSTQCVCPVCGKTFHYKGGLFYHMKQHTNERKYCCEFCDRKFYTLMALKASHPHSYWYSTVCL
ncbi:hypothetical protein NQ314_001138 [Rhamnusium bicolor]|uniref:C2H2-type domain-containing protein n=1 Tax=Rhamnusium bicolor TaxID=1586634 RepID=A0AAV8ZSZ7_9CUCU|nr:hypothetical protein NQ314_001138 [Rhamnusium bicolor]